MTRHRQLLFAANLKWLFANVPLERRFEAAASEGFRGVEIPNPYQFTPQQVRTLANNAGLRTVLINTPPGEPDSATAGGLACLPHAVPEFRAGVQLALEYATELECGIVHVVAGRRPAGLSRERAFAHLVQNVAWAAECARTTPVQLVIEMQNQRSAPGFALESQSAAAAVAEAVGAPVGLLFDVFHTQVAEGDVTRTFELHAPLIAHVQIGDAPERGEPGTGELNWSSIVDTITRAGYAGWIGCEFQPRGGSQGVLDRLRTVLR